MHNFATVKLHFCAKLLIAKVKRYKVEGVKSLTLKNKKILFLKEKFFFNKLIKEFVEQTKGEINKHYKRINYP